MDHVDSNDSMAIMLHEVCQAINKLSNNKMSGLDHITAKHMPV